MMKTTRPETSTSLLLILALALVAALPVQAQQADSQDELFGDSDPSGSDQGDPDEDHSDEYDRYELDTIVLPSEPTGSTPEPRARPQRVIDEVIVTANKIKQNVREIPGSVAALKGEALEEMGFQDAEDFLKLTPGVNITGGGRPGDSKRITVRGVSNISGTTMTTGTFWGDIPFSDPFIARVTLDPNAFDLGSVEVLKGPQGTLFGATALNGAIRYLPTPPALGEWETKLTAQVTNVSGGGLGNFLGAAVNMPLHTSEELALRLTGFHRDESGVVDELNRGEVDVDSFDQQGLRGQLRWVPGDRWQIDLSHADQRSVSADSSFTDNIEGRLERSVTPQASPVTTEYQVSALVLKYDFNWAELTTQTARTAKVYSNFSDISRNFDSPDRPLAQFVLDNESQGIVHETRLVFDFDDSPWEAIAGVFVSRTRLQETIETSTAEDTQPPLPIGGPSPIPGLPSTTGFVTEDGQLSLGRTDFDVVGEEAALFGQLKRRFGLAFEAAVSARVFVTQVGGTIDARGAVFATANNGDPEVHTDASIAERGVNPAFSLSWKPTDNLMSYFSASRGFRFGGINALANDATVDAPLTYDSDRIDNLELGLRTTWLDGALQADAAVFHFLWDKPQLFQQTEMSFSQFIDNVGAADAQGAEAALVYLPPIQGLQLALTASYTETRTKEPFVDVTGQTIPPGTLWPFAPRFQSSVSVSYKREFGAWDFGVSLVHAYLGQAFAELNHEEEVFDYHSFDLNIQLGRLDRSYWPRVDLIVGNVADERGVTALQIIEDREGNDVFYPNFIRPRAITLKLTGKF
jgi:iron complex outermembrane recepter protein